MPPNRGLANHCSAAATCWSNVVISSPLFWRDELKISFLSSKTVFILYQLAVNSLAGASPPRMLTMRPDAGESTAASGGSAEVRDQGIRSNYEGTCGNSPVVQAASLTKRVVSRL